MRSLDRVERERNTLDGEREKVWDKKRLYVQVYRIFCLCYKGRNPVVLACVPLYAKGFFPSSLVVIPTSSSSLPSFSLSLSFVGELSFFVCRERKGKRERDPNRLLCSSGCEREKGVIHGAVKIYVPSSLSMSPMPNRGYVLQI